MHSKCADERRDSGGPVPGAISRRFSRNGGFFFCIPTTKLCELVVLLVMHHYGSSDIFCSIPIEFIFLCVKAARTVTIRGVVAAPGLSSFILLVPLNRVNMKSNYPGVVSDNYPCPDERSQASPQSKSSFYVCIGVCVWFAHVWYR